MKKLDPNRVYTEFRNGVCQTKPVYGRKYTVTHSDETAELFVTIGMTYAQDKIGPIHDEVLLTFTKDGRKPILLGNVLVDGKGITGDANMRNTIFIREMPTALQAIRYADRKLFDTYKCLDNLPILIMFQSTNKEFNRVHDFGTMRDYKINT